MALTVTKFELSSRTMSGSSNKAELQFILRGFSDTSADDTYYKYNPSETSVVPIDPVYQEVQNYCEARIDRDYDGMRLDEDGLRVEHLRDNPVNDNYGEYFRITARYKRPRNQRREQNTNTQDIDETFTKSITHTSSLVPKREYYSLGTIANAVGIRPGTGPTSFIPLAVQEVFNNRQMININSETLEPEGADILRPEAGFSIEYSGNVFILKSYTRKLDALTGTVCSKAFEGYDRGEVLFAGYTLNESIEVNDWDISVDYDQGDKVTHEGVIWIAVADPSPGNEPGVSAAWQRAIPTNATLSFEFRVKRNVIVTDNDWGLLGLPYNKDTYVNYDFGVYQAIDFTDDNETPDKSDDWKFINYQAAIGRDSFNDAIVSKWFDARTGVDAISVIEGWDLIHAFYDNNYVYDNAPAGISTEDLRGTVPQMGYVEREFPRADLNQIFVIP